MEAMCSLKYILHVLKPDRLQWLWPQSESKCSQSVRATLTTHGHPPNVCNYDELTDPASLSSGKSRPTTSSCRWRLPTCSCRCWWCRSAPLSWSTSTGSTARPSVWWGLLSTFCSPPRRYYTCAASPWTGETVWLSVLCVCACLICWNLPLNLHHSHSHWSGSLVHVYTYTEYNDWLQATSNYWLWLAGSRLSIPTPLMEGLVFCS